MRPRKEHIANAYVPLKPSVSGKVGSKVDAGSAMPRQEDKTREELAADAKQMREQAKLLPPGKVRDGLLRKARQAEIASQADEWVRSSGYGRRNENRLRLAKF
jgi:hypothetical protein